MKKVALIIALEALVLSLGVGGFLYNESRQRNPVSSVGISLSAEAVRGTNAVAVPVSVNQRSVGQTMTASLTAARGGQAGPASRRTTSGSVGYRRPTRPR